jgi:hypothetical protein
MHIDPFALAARCVVRRRLSRSVMPDATYTSIFVASIGSFHP